MAWTEKQSSGKYKGVARDHRTKRKHSRTFTHQRAALKWAQELEASFRHGAPAPAKLTFADWCDDWLELRAVRASTARKDEGRLRLHIRPQWDRWPLQEITFEDVQKWINRLHRDGLGAPTVHGVHQLMSTCMAAAVRKRLIPNNPCTGAQLPQKVKPEPRWFTRDEYDRILLALDMRTIASGGRRWVPDPHRPVWKALVALACYTGLRPQELAGLDVRDLDLERRLVHVRQTLTRGGIVPYGKSDRANRWVPYPQSVADLLWPVVADKRDDAPVFVMPRGGRLEFEGNFRARVWMDALSRAGIEHERFYTCRHTFASWAVQAGVSDRKLMGYLGHADLHLIECYAHLDPHAHDEIQAMWGEDTPRFAPDLPPAPALAPTDAPISAGQGRARGR